LALLQGLSAQRGWVRTHAVAVRMHASKGGLLEGLLLCLAFARGLAGEFRVELQLSILILEVQLRNELVFLLELLHNSDA